MKQNILLAAILCAAVHPVYAANSNTLDEIVVTATRIEQPLSQSLSDVTVITAKDIAASGALDLPELLRQQAGVEIVQQGGIGKLSSLFLRGTNSDQTLILLDGARIGSATAGTTAFEHLMLDQIDHIEIVRGNVSSLYGSEAIGGVIQIFTKQGRSAPPSFHASAGIGSLGTRHGAAGFGGETGAARFNLEMSSLRTAGVSAMNPAIVPTVNPNRNGYDNRSLSGNLRYTLSTDQSLSASLFGTRGETSLDDAFAASPADTRTTRSAISKFAIASDNRISANWLSHLQLADGKDDIKNYLNGQLDNNPVSGWGTYQTRNRQLAWQNTLALGEHNLLLLGLENLQQAVSSSVNYSLTGRRISSLFGGYTGDYGAHQFQLNLRQDRNSQYGTANTGLLGYGYSFGGNWRASASYSSAFKAPTLNDLYFPLFFGFQGNPNLQPEYSRNAEIGLHYAAGRQQLGIVHFDNRIRNLIAINPAWTTMININRARSDGVELSYQGQFDDTGITAALTSQNPRDTGTGQTLLRRARLHGSVGVTQLLGNWHVKGEWLFSGSRDDSYTDPISFATTRMTLPNYNLFNLAASHVIGTGLELSLRADNITNRNDSAVYGYNPLGRTVYVGLNYRP